MRSYNVAWMYNSRSLSLTCFISTSYGRLWMGWDGMRRDEISSGYNIPLVFTFTFKSTAQQCDAMRCHEQCDVMSLCLYYAMLCDDDDDDDDRDDDLDVRSRNRVYSLFICIDKSLCSLLIDTYEFT